MLVTVLVMVSAALFFALRGGSDEGHTGSGPSGERGITRVYSLNEVGMAGMLTVMVYDESDNISSVMVSSRAAEFDSFVHAIRDARLTPGEPDESFSDLLVFSFSSDNTLEIPYSRDRGLLIYRQQLYDPSGDLTTLIETVEEKFE